MIVYAAACFITTSGAAIARCLYDMLMDATCENAVLCYTYMS
jgi:hypothetical protein